MWFKLEIVNDDSTDRGGQDTTRYVFCWHTGWNREGYIESREDGQRGEGGRKGHNKSNTCFRYR